MLWGAQFCSRLIIYLRCHHPYGHQFESRLLYFPSNFLQIPKKTVKDSQSPSAPASPWETWKKLHPLGFRQTILAVATFMEWTSSQKTFSLSLCLLPTYSAKHLSLDGCEHTSYVNYKQVQLKGLKTNPNTPNKREEQRKKLAECERQGPFPSLHCRQQQAIMVPSLWVNRFKGKLL